MRTVYLEIKSQQLGKINTYVVNAYEQKGTIQSYIGIFSGSIKEIKEKIAIKIGADVKIEKSAFMGWY